MIDHIVERWSDPPGKPNLYLTRYYGFSAEAGSWEPMEYLPCLCVLCYHHGRKLALPDKLDHALVRIGETASEEYIAEPKTKEIESRAEGAAACPQ